MFGHVMPMELKYRLKNGKVVRGSYCKRSKRLTGLEDVYLLTDLKQFEFLLFTYCGDGPFEVSAFVVSCIEKDIRYGANIQLGID